MFYLITNILLAEVRLGIAFYFLGRFILQYREEGLEKKDFMPLVVSLSFSCYFIAQIFFILREFTIDFNFSTDTPESLLFLKLGSYTNALGNWAFLIILDKRALHGRDKYLVSIIYLCLINIMVSFDDPGLLGIISLIGNLLLLPFVIIYLYVGLKIKGVVRKKAFYIFTGVILISLGFAIPSPNFLGGDILRSGILSIIKSIGYIFCFLGFKIPIPEDETIEESSESLIKMLGLDLNRSNLISEEEISISKEKKICLVCKGKLSRLNIYLCPECDTFYCEKCINILTKLENACWVCKTAFDETKPQKLFKVAEDNLKDTLEMHKSQK